jgi:D-threo-aldose 1-dehydrogenase
MRVALHTGVRADRVAASEAGHSEVPAVLWDVICVACPVVVRVVGGAGSASEVHDCADQFAATVPEACWRELRQAGLLPGEEVS